MGLRKNIDRLIRGEKGLCPHCNHSKARSSILGTYCMRCKRDINEETDRSKIKPMRPKGAPKFKGRIGEITTS